MRSRYRASAGFTLVETLVSLAILGLCMAVLFKVVSDNLDRSRRSRDESLAASLAQSVLAQASQGMPGPGARSGTTADGLSWRLLVTPYDGTGTPRGWPVGAVTIAAIVTWQDGGRAYSRTLTTMRVVPKAASE